MKQGGGRLKGNLYEREIAAKLIAAFACHGITKEHCYRTPSSGGHRYAKKVDPGDLVFDPVFRRLWNVAVECKDYHKVDMSHLLSSPWQGNFVSWWQQARKAAKLTHARPVLVFKWFRTTDYAMLFWRDVKTKNLQHISHIRSVDSNGRMVVILLLSDLLKLVVPERTTQR